MGSKCLRSLCLDSNVESDQISDSVRFNRSISLFGIVVLTLIGSANVYALSEWTYHRSADGTHPNGQEQEVVWLMNRARSDPGAEGNRLAVTNHPDVAIGRSQFQVDLNMLKQEFRDINAMPPAALDYRLSDAARAHAVNLIGRDSQDHDGQLDRVNDQGVRWTNYRGSVFSYANSAINAHAAFNIDWGPGPGNMQTGRGHRVGLMSADANYSNVGVAIVEETNSSTAVGENVIVVNYTKLNYTYPDHFNRFVVGTVWQDSNQNGRYDAGEGIPGVVVTPSSGSYYAVTSAGGGYAFPAARNTNIKVSFSGAGVQSSDIDVKMASHSVLVDYELGSGVASDAEIKQTSGKHFYVPLEFNVSQDERLGWLIGSKKNKYEARYLFDGNSHAVILKVVGWHVNSLNEVKVKVNGKVVGRLARTSTNNPSRSNRIVIPRNILRGKNNLVRFIQLRPGDRWGVSNVKLQRSSN